MASKEWNTLKRKRDCRSSHFIYQGLPRILQVFSTYTVALFFALLPSFVTDRLQGKTQAEIRVLPTTYLDGLRGLVSIRVFIRHFLHPWIEDLDTGYGQVNNKSLLKLPFVCLAYSGPSVPVLFIASGFVLSIKPLKYIRRNEFPALCHAMISSIFRRSIRLFVPPIITTFLVAIAVYLGWYSTDYDMMPGQVPRHPDRFSSLLVQMADWLRFVTVDLINPWDWKSPKSEYDTHLWTISIQFRASMIVFLTTFALSKLRPRTRSFFLAAFTIYSLQQLKWQMACFFTGMILAEQSFNELEARGQRVSPTLELPLFREKASSSLMWTFLRRSIFILGLYLGSYPAGRDAGSASLFFVWFSKLTNNYYYWHTSGAILIVWSIGNEPLLQEMLSNSTCHYLGRVSYSVYLVHGPILHLFGYSLVPRISAITAPEQPVSLHLGTVIAFLILTPIVLWVADVFFRLVDKPCAVLAAYIETKCFV